MMMIYQYWFRVSDGKTECVASIASAAGPKYAATALANIADVSVGMMVASECMNNAYITKIADGSRVVRRIRPIGPQRAARNRCK